MKFRGGEFSTGTLRNFQSELTKCANAKNRQSSRSSTNRRWRNAERLHVQIVKLVVP